MVYILTGNLAYFMLGQGERTMHMLKIDQTFKNIEKNVKIVIKCRITLESKERHLCVLSRR